MFTGLNEITSFRDKNFKPVHKEFFICLHNQLDNDITGIDFLDVKTKFSLDIRKFSDGVRIRFLQVQVGLQKHNIRQITHMFKKSLNNL